MLRGLWKLTWLETKIFLREPLGVIGSVGFPILLFLLMRRMGRAAPRNALPPLLAGDLPIFAAVMVSLSAVVSLVAIIAIYREGGILKRLRATPLQPVTILLAHVMVKLGFTALSLGVLVLAGARSFGPAGGVPLVSFAVALLFTTLCLLSIGFIIASLVPTARFAQPLATLVVYAMLGFSGLFVSLDRMPAGMQVVARLMPMAHAVALLRGIWHGEGWLAHAPEAGVLAVMFLALTALASRVFRWE
jgi:ABC-2 type transport system permease protein